MVLARLAWGKVRKVLLTAGGKLMLMHTCHQKVNRTSSRSASCTGNAEGPEGQRGRRGCTEQEKQHLGGHLSAPIVNALQK